MVARNPSWGWGGAIGQEDTPNNSRMRDPSFLNAQDREAEAEAARRREDRQRRGLCAQCGRPMRVAWFRSDAAGLHCRACDRRVEVKRGTKAFAAARIAHEMGGVQ